MRMVWRSYHRDRALEEDLDHNLGPEMVGSDGNYRHVLYKYTLWEIWSKRYH